MKSFFQITPPDSPLFALGVWFFVMGGIRLLNQFSGAGWFSENSMVMTAVLLIYPPIIIAFFKKQSLAYLKYNKDQLKTDFKWFGIMSVVVFLASLSVNHVYQLLFLGNSFKAPEFYDLEKLGFYALTQLILVAFPEEFFFRGYLQDSFYSKWPPKHKIFGVPVGGSTLALSLLFAISHSLIVLQWWHALIFFPAMLFSWLRSKTGTIWAALFFHWACNLFSYWVFLHYRP